MTSKARRLTAIAMSIIAIAVLGTIVPMIPNAHADAPPEYGMFPQGVVAMTPSVADQTLLAAPGSDMSWMVTSIWWEVTAAEANAIATVEDAAGTPISVLYIPLDTKGSIYQVFLGDGVLCSQNSAVQVDFSGAVGELAMALTAHKVRVGD